MAVTRNADRAGDLPVSAAELAWMAGRMREADAASGEIRPGSTGDDKLEGSPSLYGADAPWI